MYRVLWRHFATLLAGVVNTLAAAIPPDHLSLSALEERLQDIDARLAQLANYNPGGGIGAIGYRSRSHDRAGQTEWVEIEFGNTVPLDQVLLVPAIRRDAVKGFLSDGFPERFRLRVGTGQDRQGRVVAEYTGGALLLPRIAPFVIPCQGTRASWIRIEAQTLSQRAFDSKYVFQLSEILAFSGQENVALHKPVRSFAANDPGAAQGWAESYVVDGVVPYLMAAAHGTKSAAFVNVSEMGDRPALTIDLGASYPLSRLCLHAVDQSDTVPQAFAGDFGIPQELRVEGADAPDFSDAKVLIELHHDTIYDIGPIMTRPFPETDCRYVRLQVVKPNDNPLYGKIPARLGFAEIELFSRGRNVALNKPVAANFKADHPVRRLSNLTDGMNYYGTILSIRDWLNQLALRHELETERPLVSAELGQRYARQKANLNLLAWLTVALVLGVVGVILFDRARQRRALELTRKRIAADLHDELGADLHALGLLSDLAQAARTAPDKLADLLQRMRALTERTGKAARHCTNMLEARDLYGDLVDDMRRTSDRILADLEHQLEFEDPEKLRQLSPRKRIDLLLFFQESLINIIRHSGATRTHTRLSVADGQITLTVSDNGLGLAGKIPPSLKRRARLLGAEVDVGASESSGSCIVLRLKRRWPALLP